MAEPVVADVDEPNWAQHIVAALPPNRHFRLLVANSFLHHQPRTVRSSVHQRSNTRYPDITNSEEYSSHPNQNENQTAIMSWAGTELADAPLTRCEGLTVCYRLQEECEPCDDAGDDEDG